MFISSEKAAVICNKVQYGEATFMEKLSLRIHLIFSRKSASYTKKNTKFTELCEKANLQGLSEKDKLQMKNQINEHQK